MFLKSFLFAEESPLDFLGSSHEPTEPKDDAAKKAAADAAEKARKEAEEKKKGKGKDEQVAEIRRQRDDLLKETERLKKIEEEFEKLKGVKPVADYVEKKFGKVDDEAINKFIEKNKERKNKLGDLEKKYGEKEQTVRDLEITRSDMWIEDYAKPLQKADQDLFATIVMVDKDGQVRYPELFSKLKQTLLTVDKDGKPKNSIQIKQALKEFATEFKQTTQEDYEIPKLTDVTVAVEGAYNKYTTAIKAKQDWEKTTEEKNKERAYDNAQKSKRDTETIILQRGKAVEVVKQQFKYDTLDGLFEEEEVKEEIDKIHDNVVKIMKGEQKPTEYNIFTEGMAKGALFDKLVEKYKELETKYQKDIGKKHSSLPSGSAGDRGDKKVVKEDPSHEGLGFLR